MLVLGLESSCDETAVGLVRRRADGGGAILAARVRTQADEHAPYGGVVPEIAARAHIAFMDELIGKALQDAGVSLRDLDGIAATAGPGLLGGLLVGAVTGKTLTTVLQKPYLAINHLEAHALTPRLTHNLAFPYLVLLVSGGHTQILSVDDVGRCTRLATTVDDALGEAFDKVAKLLGLGFPGGPEVERRAQQGNPTRFAFPRPMLGRAEPYFSFSGLKTAVRHCAEAQQPLDEQTLCDICAGFQAAAAASLSDRVDRALQHWHAAHRAPVAVAIAGGVAANKALASVLQETVQRHGDRLVVPPAELCTDNGVMIAWAGAERLAVNRIDNPAAVAVARWPLDPGAAPAPYAGVKA